MLLSIITHHRNDNYMGNSLWRMQTCLNKWGRILELLGTDYVEIICCDWGSTVPLTNVLDLEPGIKKRLTFITISPDIAKVVEGDSEYSSSHATNVASRHAYGKYFLYLDIDVFFQIDTLRTLLKCLGENLIGGNNLAKTFYWGSRYHIPKDFNDTYPSLEMLDIFIDNHKHTLRHDRLNTQSFMGAATALLVTRTMWYAARGFNEKLRYMGANDIDLHERLRMRYEFGGDLEDYGMPFYHLEHYGPGRILNKDNHRKHNQEIYGVAAIRPTTFEVNDERWGLVPIN